jgi:flagellar protein FliS
MRGVPIGAYAEVQTTTADPASLVLLLFDGAAWFLHRSRKALDAGDTGGFAQSVSRAHAIIGELAGAVDAEVGGELAVKLIDLYRFLLVHLTQGLVAKSPEHLERVLGILQTLREGFEAAVEAHRRASTR